MAMVINSNIQSLNAQRHLNNSLEAQNTATERLSSGLRINSAKDDAAGLAIANRMTSQVQGLNQAVRNANDGAALIQTAEGGLEETTNILQRMRELSIQSANGTYDTGNRDTLNAEVKQLKLEIDRISETTSFNGLNILDGSLGDIDLQVGENANQTIGLSLDSTSTQNLGGAGTDVVGQLSSSTVLLTGLQVAADGTETIAINGADVGDLTNATDLQDALNIMNQNLGSAATVGTLVDVTASTQGDGILSGADALTFTITHADTTTTAINIQNTANMDELVTQINERGNGAIEASLDKDGKISIASEGAASIGITVAGTATLADTLGASVIATTNARLTIESDSDKQITVEYDDAAVGSVETGIDQRLVSGEIVGNANIAVAAAINQGDVIINGVEMDEFVTTVDYDGNGATGDDNDLAAWINRQADETGVTASLDADTVTFLKLTSGDGGEISLNYRDGTTTGLTNMGMLETNDVESAGGSVSQIDISSAEGAQKAIGILDEAIKQVSEQRGDLGAVSNRLDYTTRNLSNISENAASARSQIMDADFAAESANLSRAQVLQQAGNAMLAQANSRPQQVLSLLQ